MQKHKGGEVVLQMKGMLLQNKAPTAQCFCKAIFRLIGKKNYATQLSSDHAPGRLAGRSSGSAASATNGYNKIVTATGSGISPTGAIEHSEGKYYYGPHWAYEAAQSKHFWPNSKIIKTAKYSPTVSKVPDLTESDPECYKQLLAKTGPETQFCLPVNENLQCEKPTGSIFEGERNTERIELPPALTGGSRHSNPISTVGNDTSLEKKAENKKAVLRVKVTTADRPRAQEQRISESDAEAPKPGLCQTGNQKKLQPQVENQTAGRLLNKRISKCIIRRPVSNPRAYSGANIGLKNFRTMRIVRWASKLRPGNIESSERLGKSSSFDTSRNVREVMRNVPQAVAILTTATPPVLVEDEHIKYNPDPIGIGMTLSSVTTVSLDPEPVISFNVKKPSHTLEALRHHGHFLVHYPTASQEGAFLAHHFTKGSVGEQRQQFDTWPMVTPVPFINHQGNEATLPAIIADNNHPISSIFQCEVANKNGFIDVGDHVLVLGRVEKTWHFTSPPSATSLVYARGQYTTIDKNSYKTKLSELSKQESVHMGGGKLPLTKVFKPSKNLIEIVTKPLQNIDRNSDTAIGATEPPSRSRTLILTRQLGSHSKIPKSVTITVDLPLTEIGENEELDAVLCSMGKDIRTMWPEGQESFRKP